MTKNKRNILKICISILLILSISVHAMADKVKTNEKDDNIDKDWKEPDNVKIGDSKPIITIDPVTKIGRAVFIHWSNDVKTSVTTNAVSGTCYSTFATWSSNIPVTYTINPTNSQGLSSTFIKSAIFTSAETWDAATGKELFSNTYKTDSKAKFGRRDGKNSIVFGRYYQPSAIAVTGTWFNSITGQIYESDMLLNTNFRWGDATKDSSKMDVINIATHEFGHVVGLDDISSSSCIDVTMYAYSNSGETKKRTLETPDITGLLALYPNH